MIEEERMPKKAKRNPVCKFTKGAHEPYEIKKGPYRAYTELCGCGKKLRHLYQCECCKKVFEWEWMVFTKNICRECMEKDTRSYTGNIGITRCYSVTVEAQSVAEAKRKIEAMDASEIDARGELIGEEVAPLYDPPVLDE